MSGIHGWRGVVDGGGHDETGLEAGEFGGFENAADRFDIGVDSDSWMVSRYTLVVEIVGLTIIV